MDFNFEKELVQRVKDDSKEFVKLYDLYFDRVYKYVFRRIDDVDAVHDVVSQTFYDILTNIARYEFRGVPFGVWVFKIAHNNVLKWCKVSAKVFRLDVEEMKKVSGNEDVVETVKVDENQVLVRKALESLDFEEKEILRLKYFEEFSNIEIAEVMSITANNVGVKLYRALKKLKQILPKNF